jgi:uncharacterized protein (TIGR02996 family)
MTVTPSPDLSALFHAICQDPMDDLARLAYADVLEEMGQTSRAEFIRVQIELARLPYEQDADGQVYLDECLRNHKCELERRQRDLFSGSGPLFWNDLPGAHRATVEKDISVESACGNKYLISRGFVSEVRCYQQKWLDHGQVIVRLQPVEKVVLTDRFPTLMNQKTADYPDLYRWYWSGQYASQEKGTLVSVLFDALDLVMPKWPAAGSRYHHLPLEVCQSALSAACLVWAKPHVAR